ncbi:MAG TPA: argininosuccinate lyase [Acidimicrobiia bacterium]|nr:argininosuccinate lyase [Acidimicrobiia bacterium]
MTLWGGRFEAAPSERLWSYTVDSADRRLLAVDVRGSLAHGEMLAKVGILTGEEWEEMEAGLRTILADAADDTFEFLPTDEDVHSAVERRLVELVGEVGEKLHTGRSRNDQIALDLRLYLRQAVEERVADIAAFIDVLCDQAEANAGSVVASYTHLQQAQAISLGHHLLAYAWMLRRDQERLTDLGRRLRESPLGAGASAGSTLPLDPAYTASLLGFGSTLPNSLDAVSSRDLVAEFVFACAQAMVNLSRLAEDFILWSTTEFGWVTLADAYTTGSSALPHKKNPDIAELARGRAATTLGTLTAILALQKGLPLAYNRDLQEDKPALFAADDALGTTLGALRGMVATARFHAPPPSSWTAALDLAETLVRRGVPFRQAHEAVGRLVVRLLGEGRTLAGATESDLAAADPRFQPQDLDCCRPDPERRSLPGSGSPRDVLRQIALLRTPGPGAQ